MFKVERRRIGAGGATAAPCGRVGHPFRQDRPSCSLPTSLSRCRVAEGSVVLSNARAAPRSSVVSVCACTASSFAILLAAVEPPVLERAAWLAVPSGRYADLRSQFYRSWRGSGGDVVNALLIALNSAMYPLPDGLDPATNVEGFQRYIDGSPRPRSC